jgi:proteasome lid subunit RPN8/RPN11
MEKDAFGMPDLYIRRDVFQKILQGAADSPKREICGLLYGKSDKTGRTGTYYIPIENIATSPNQFRMDPKHLTDVLFSMQSQQNLELVAIVHSHPFGMYHFVPSEEDLRSHWSEDVWSVIVYRGSDGWQLSAFLIERGMYTKVEVHARNKE